MFDNLELDGSMYDVTRQAIGLLVSEIYVAASVPSRNSPVSSHRMGVAMLVNDPHLRRVLNDPHLGKRSSVETK